MCPSLPSKSSVKLSAMELDWADGSVFRLAENANCISPKACAVSAQRRFSVFLSLLTTYNFACVLLPLYSGSVEKYPSTGKGLSEP